MGNAMTQWLLPTHNQVDRSALHVAELLHRVRNEYARAISFASLLAARSSSHETKSALGEVINHLHSATEVHSVLRPPHAGGLVDFTDSITRLCRAMTASLEMAPRGITLLLDIEEPVFLDAGRCWRANLIASELVNNACRHAFISRGGRISVTVTITPDRILCQVSDDGSSIPNCQPGLGTHLVDALAAELDGSVERQHSNYGAVVTLSFPRDPIDPSFQLQDGWDGYGRRNQ
jgi:two-component sensor histidine kinase